MKRGTKQSHRLDRKALEIQIWLKRRGIRQRDIMRSTGKDEATVSRTIHGKESNRWVIGHLKKIGVPLKYLGDK